MYQVTERAPPWRRPLKASDALLVVDDGEAVDQVAVALVGRRALDRRQGDPGRRLVRARLVPAGQPPPRDVGGRVHVREGRADPVDAAVVLGRAAEMDLGGVDV